MEIRAIRPDDRRALEAAFEALSPRSRYRRFMGFVEHLTPAQLDYFTRVDHIDHEALVAVRPHSGEIVGVARFIRLADRPDHAEVAIAVADAWQEHGIGTLLLARLATRACAVGIRNFVATCLAENRHAIDVLSELGPTRQAIPVGGEVELDITLPERTRVAATAA